MLIKLKDEGKNNIEEKNKINQILNLKINL